MARRTYLPTLRSLANAICRLLVPAIPTIKKIFPDELVLHALLDTLNTACAEVVVECDRLIEIGD